MQKSKHLCRCLASVSAEPECMEVNYILMSSYALGPEWDRHLQELKAQESGITRVQLATNPSLQTLNKLNEDDMTRYCITFLQVPQ